MKIQTATDYLPWCGRGALTPRGRRFDNRTQRGGGTPPTKAADGGHRPPLQLSAVLRPQSSGFTLLELLVVIGLIAALSLVLFKGLGGGGNAATLHSAQAVVSSLVTAARTKAPATNRKTRLLVSVDPASPERYLRYLVLQLARQTGPSPADWDTLQSITLPAGAYVVPVSLTGLVADATQWKRVSNPAADLSSDLFQNQSLSYALEGDPALQLWTGVAFTPNGTLAALVNGPPPKGSIVLALGQPLAPGSFAAGDPPIQLNHAQAVRGLIFSAYGVPALLNERNAF